MTCPACNRSDCTGGPVECCGHVAHGRVWVNGCPDGCGVMTMAPPSDEPPTYLPIMRASEPHDALIRFKSINDERTGDERAE